MELPKLQEIIDKHYLWLESKGNIGSQANLSYLPGRIFWTDDNRAVELSNEKVDLSGYDLTGINFTDAILSNVKMTGCNLENTIFVNADLKHVDFSGANLARTNFSDSNLSNANLSKANIDNSNFTRSNLAGANLTFVCLSNSIFSNTIFNRASLNNTCLKELVFHECSFESCKLYDCDLRNVTIEGTNLSESIFSRSDLSKSNFKKSIFNSAYLDEVNAYHADFQDTKFLNSNFKNAEIVNSNFSGSDLTLSDLRGAKLINSKFIATVLQGVKLNNSDLSNANLYFANLDNYHKAFEDKKTVDGKIITTRKYEIINTDISGTIWSNTDLSVIKISKSAIDQLPDDIKEKFQSTFNVSLQRSNLFSKTIQFEKGYASVGASVLTTFASLIKEKYPDPSLNVSITQLEETKVRLEVRTEEGDLVDAVEHDLKNFVGALTARNGVENLAIDEFQFLNGKIDLLRQELIQTQEINDKINHDTSNGVLRFFSDLINNTSTTIKGKDMESKKVIIGSVGTYIDTNRGLSVSGNYYNLPCEDEQIPEFLEEQVKEIISSGLTQEEATTKIGHRLKEMVKLNKGVKSRLVKLGDKFADTSISEIAKTIIRIAIGV